ncbi:hypothetical protein CHUAL_012034 [Chamberlinius hualienensis]
MYKSLLWMGLILVWLPGYPCIHIFNQQVSSDIWSHSKQPQQPQPPRLQQQINSEISNNWPFQHQHRTKDSSAATKTKISSILSSSSSSKSSIKASESPSESDFDDDSVNPVHERGSTFVSSVGGKDALLRHSKRGKVIGGSEISRKTKSSNSQKDVSSSSSSTLSTSSSVLSNKNSNKNTVEHKNIKQSAGEQSQMKRQPRGNRQYDVPQIECPPVEDGMERFSCPTPDRMGRYRCIDDHVLCDGFIDCPNAEDEDRLACMFYKTTKTHLDVLADALLRWARGR